MSDFEDATTELAESDFSESEMSGWSYKKVGIIFSVQYIEKSHPS